MNKCVVQPQMLYTCKRKQTKLFCCFFKVGNDKGQAVLQVEASELPVNNEDLSKVKKLAKTTHI